MIVLWNILGPNTIARVQIEPIEGGRFRVNYLPSEAGIYTVNMMFNGREVEGDISALTQINFMTNITTLGDLGLNGQPALVNKLVPCAWLSSCTLGVWRFRLQFTIRFQT